MDQKTRRSAPAFRRRHSRRAALLLAVATVFVLGIGAFVAVLEGAAEFPAENPGRMLLTTTLAGSLGEVLVLTLIALGFFRQLLRPVVKLAALAAALARGETRQRLMGR